ncbi:PP2C family protein-serine/threonine phosphatase [Acidipila sp. EB88]|uniref:PP2C family protein-serine/threonine phosphatase n=1 Tax=Acidipila sp. EB88 TaxID=2305226 RepID=UPI00131508F0|nr:SpoIIE family protein phosphatase [Acidipila sp. EB88]
MQKSRFRSRLSAIFAAIAILWPGCLGTRLSAQAIDLDAGRFPITSIANNWRTHPGDDRRWAQPDFDDSHWKVIQPDRDWIAQGYAEQNNLAWFRLRLSVPAHTDSLVVQLPRLEKSYQLFADARLIGQTGRLPPQHAIAVTGSARVFTVPVHPSDRRQFVTLALRLWQSPQLVGISANVLAGRAYAGDAAIVLRQFAQVKAAALLSRGSAYTQEIIVLIVGAATLLMFCLTRQSFYLWFALNMLFSACDLPMHLLSQHFAWGFLHVLYGYMLLDLLLFATFALFVLRALNLKSHTLSAVCLALCLASETGPLLLLVNRASLVWADGIYALCSTALDLLLFLLLIRGWRTGSADAKLLLLPYTLGALIGASGNLGHWFVDLHVPHADALISADVELLREPFAVSLNDIGNIVTLLGLLTVLVYRFAQTSREEQRLAAALQAAHDIQHRLVPVDLPQLGGLHSEIVYLAAEEVGGDFCQVLPRPDGSIFIAIGDVSGKGLQAAMLGTLAVGALRSMADEDIGPAAALRRLHHAVLRTGSASFITCLCLKLAPTGEVLLANAGHLSPYLNGQEVATAAGLPLGVLAQTEYLETTLMLPAVARLTLLSDGVVEARSRNGELFGFDRTMRISQQPASDIAAAAHRHGQEDDITILTLDWCQPTLASA